MQFMDELTRICEELSLSYAGAAEILMEEVVRARSDEEKKDISFGKLSGFAFLSEYQ